MKKKKNANSFLYAGLKNQVNTKSGNVESKEKPSQIKRKLVVAVTSLKHGTGCSYIGMAAANYLTKVDREKVCFLHKGCAYVDSVLCDDADSIFYPCSMGEVYSRYGYIVYDGGVMHEIDRGLLDRSDIKLMVCWPNEEYIRLLAEFIKTRNDLDNWVFLFGQVPEKRQGKIYDLMDDFAVRCIPTFDATHMDKQMISIFEKIFIG